jgi:uncharacterized damage-inducible protein DinB
LPWRPAAWFNPSEETAVKSIVLVSACVACAIRAAGQAPSNPLTDTVMTRYQSVHQNLAEAAEAMPEEGYSFHLTPPQRSFGEWIGHTAMVNYGACAVIKGEAPPDSAALHHLTAKAELTAALQKSFEYCDAALKGMTDQKALAAVTVGGKTVYPVQGMIGLVAAENEHYGNLVGYLRSKGITPPSSAHHK